MLFPHARPTSIHPHNWARKKEGVRTELYRCGRPLLVQDLHDALPYSHSIVAGGFEEMSYTTRFTPRTLFIISFDRLARNS